MRLELRLGMHRGLGLGVGEEWNLGLGWPPQPPCWMLQMILKTERTIWERGGSDLRASVWGSGSGLGLGRLGFEWRRCPLAVAVQEGEG